MREGYLSPVVLARLGCNREVRPIADHNVSRKLAAILAADVAGYTRLMEADEEATLAAWWAARKDVIDPSVAEHGGRIVKHTGDGFLAEFATATQAVRCAVAMQTVLKARSADAPGERRFDFRMGINLGEIVADAEDIYGDGVNIAARIEALAEPGGICVTRSVYEQVRKKLPLAVEDMGARAVKNLAEPVSTYRIVLDAGAGDRAGSKAQAPSAAVLPSKPSIVVLPFDNMSNDAEQEYFSDGITEDIITELSKISGLFVIARHSAFTYKGKSVKLSQVGRELGVRYVLEGSVRKAQSRLRITAQLTDAITDHHVWADRYDRNLEDVFAVQDEVARSVATALAVALNPDEHERLGRAPTENIAAYDLYLRTRSAPWPPTRENILAARKAYERIAEIDPTFAGGHAGAALACGLSVIFGHSDQPAADAERAIRTAQKALAIDDRFALGHSALGLGYLANGRRGEAVSAAS
jgi:adenylate cyclase